MVYTDVYIHKLLGTTAAGTNRLSGILSNRREFGWQELVWQVLPATSTEEHCHLLSSLRNYGMTWLLAGCCTGMPPGKPTWVALCYLYIYLTPGKVLWDKDNFSSQMSVT